VSWSYDVAYFSGGVFLTNALPHFISGLMGRSFQSPFAKPAGAGLSSSTVNVLWGFSNLVVAYALICRIGDFNLRSTEDAGALGLSVLAIGLFSARTFGKFNGGNSGSEQG
jgi:hypothetical protein